MQTINFKSLLPNISSEPGVYQMLGENNEVLYVGKAKNLKKRLTTYFSSKPKDIKTTALLTHVTNVEIIVARNENEALILECNLIKKFRPRYNILFRDDKSYPYIVIKGSPYPRIDFYRGPIKKDGYYFGPYPNSTAVRETIHLIQKIFHLRTCNDNFFSTRTRACLHHQIGLCSGSCVGLITPEEYAQNVQHAILFLQGKNQQIYDELTKQMEDAAAQLNYELAAKIRNQLIKLRQIQEKQYVSSAHGDADIIGLSDHKDIICIQLLIIRGGRVLGSRSYFPSVPEDSSKIEIITAFITQHYLHENNLSENISQANFEIPKEIIVEINLPEKKWLESTLSTAAKRKVTIATSVRGERKKWLEMAKNSASQSIARDLLSKSNTNARFIELQKILNLEHPIKRIECFDISHTMGEATVASCVVFNEDGPVKSDYRRFNINEITPGDDIAAMRQAILRRYRKLQTSEQQLPCILLIDGGPAQLHVAQDVLQELQLDSIFLIGVAKGTARKPGFETLHFTHGDPHHLPADSLALLLIQQIRDEAHRFAITGHRARRDQKRRTSVLESIPGIGAARRRELLRYFGGIQAINRASLDELSKVPGISEALALRIYEALKASRF